MAALSAYNWLLPLAVWFAACRWRFPGVGEYQCCDKYMLADLRAAARAAGHPEWGHGGPHDAGHYNSRSWETGFFVSQGGNWQTEYGHFFLSWYSGLLVRHARRILGVAAEVLNKPGRPRMLKAVKEVSFWGFGVCLSRLVVVIVL